MKHPNVNVSEVSFVPPPPSLSLPKNAKTRRIAFPQPAPTCSSDAAGRQTLPYPQCSVAHRRCNSSQHHGGAAQRRRELRHDIYTSCEPFKPSKSRRQAHPTSTRISPCPVVVVHALSTLEAPRSGAVNLNTIYPRPANHSNPRNKPPVGIWRPGLRQRRGLCIVEALTRRINAPRAW
ncbi:hypothetical protein C8R47DRAFT_1078883 [Mycena vitilis]|nr:hypothetical protein C8R47DRAFT_1078883 [Mycena vitilis]